MATRLPTNFSTTNCWSTVSDNVAEILTPSVSSLSQLFLRSSRTPVHSWMCWANLCRDERGVVHEIRSNRFWNAISEPRCKQVDSEMCCCVLFGQYRSKRFSLSLAISFDWTMCRWIVENNPKFLSWLCSRRSSCKFISEHYITENVITIMLLVSEKNVVSSAIEYYYGQTYLSSTAFSNVSSSSAGKR